MKLVDAWKQKFPLIEDWKRKFPELWSVRFALLGGLLSSVEVGVTMWATGRPPLMAAAAAVACFAAAFARIVAQPELMK